MLERAIKSVIAQTFKDWELIIVDDNSNDGKTEKVCDKYLAKDGRIRVIKRGSNFGSHTRPKNEGTKAAGADLIAYLDDDNTYRRDHLQVLYKYLGKNDIVYGDRWMIDKTGVGKDTLGLRSEFNSRLLAQENYIDTSDVLIRKSCIEKIGGWNEELPVFADWNLWIRLSKAGFKFQHIPIIISDYYIHKGMNQFRNPADTHPVTGKVLPTYFQPDSCKLWPDKTLYGERPKLKVAIFTLTMDRLEYTKRMMQSMKSNAHYEYDWFVVDNGSKDATIGFLKTMPQTTLISNTENVGISKGSNQALDAIKKAGKEYDIIIKVDNDCLFLTEDWLKEIVDLFERQKKVVVSPRVEGLMDNPGGVPRTQFIYIDKHFLGMAPHLGGICIAAPAELYENFRWEEDSFLHGEQDYIFSQYVIGQSYILAYMENSIVEHMDTTYMQDKKYPEYADKKKELKTIRYEEDKKA